MASGSASPPTGSRAGSPTVASTRQRHRGLEDPRLPDERAAPRRHQPGRDRAHPRSPAHRRPHRPPGHRDRAPGQRGRPPAGGPGQDHRQPQGAAQHPGDQAARARRRPHRPGRGRPAVRPGRVPPRHEAGRAERPEGGRAGHPGAVLRAPGWLRDGAHRELPRGPGAAAHAARRHRLRLPRGPHHRRPHRREGVALQGRCAALQVAERGQDLPRGRHGRGRDVGRRRSGRLVSDASCRRPRVAAAPPRSPRPRSRPSTSPSSRRPTPSSSGCWPRRKRSSAGCTTTTRRPTSVRETSRC